MNKTLEDYISNLNAAIAKTKKSTLMIFEIFAEATLKLNNTDFEEFTTNINMEESSIRKMKRICKKKVIIEHLEELPISWGTLYEMSRVDDELLIKLIDDNTFNSRTTKKTVLEIINGKKDAVPARNESNDEDASQSDTDITCRLKNKTVISDVGITAEVIVAINILKKYFDVESNLISQLKSNVKETA